MSTTRPIVPPKIVEKLKNNGAFAMQDKYLKKFGMSFRGYDICRETPDEYLETITKAYNQKTEEIKHSE